MVEYVKWRGDIPLTEDNFNDADNLVLCALTYVNFAECLSFDESKSLRNCVAQLEGMEKNRYRLIYVSRPFEELVREAAGSKRFGELILKSFRELSDSESHLQFAAMTFEIEPGFSYIAFRGTDCQLDGWRENFMLSFSQVGAQREAKRYAEEVIRDGGYIIGGHSKGGNLALYAAETISDSALGHVRSVYVNDAPGLCREALGIEDTGRISKICRRIRPEYSIIGSLFERGFPETIVKSDAVGAFQHDIVSWQVSGSSLVTAEAHSEESERLCEIIRLWIEEMSIEQRREFIGDLFDTLAGRNRGLESFEKETLRFLGFSGLTLRRVHRLGAIASGAISQKKSGEQLSRLFRVWKENPEAKLLLILLTGAVFVLFPYGAVVTLTAAAAAAFLINRVAAAARAVSDGSLSEKTRRRKLLLCLGLLGLYGALVIREGALAGIAGLLCGGILLATSAAVLKTLRNGKTSDGRSLGLFSRLLRIAELAGCVSFGIYFLIAPASGFEMSTLLLGNAMIIDGALRSAELFASLLSQYLSVYRDKSLKSGFFVASAVENRGEI